MTTSTPGHEPGTAGNTGSAGNTGIPDGAHAEIPAWLLRHHGASPGARLLYGAISMHLADGGEWPTTEALAQILGIAERTVRAHLKELVLIGAVHRERGVGYHTGRRYRLRDQPAPREEGACR